MTDSEFVWASTWPFPYLQDGDMEGTGRIRKDTALDLNNLRVCKGWGPSSMPGKGRASRRNQGHSGTQGDPAMVTGGGEADGHLGRAEEVGGMEVSSPEPVLIRTSSDRAQLWGSARVLRWRAGW